MPPFVRPAQGEGWGKGFQATAFDACQVRRCPWPASSLHREDAGAAWFRCLFGEVRGDVVHAPAPAIIGERVGHLDVDRFRAIAAGPEVRRQVDGLVGLVRAVGDPLALLQHRRPVLIVGTDLDQVFVIDGQGDMR